LIHISTFTRIACHQDILLLLLPLHAYLLLLSIETNILIVTIIIALIEEPLSNQRNLQVDYPLHILLLYHPLLCCCCILLPSIECYLHMSRNMLEITIPINYSILLEINYNYLVVVVVHLLWNSSNYLSSAINIHSDNLLIDYCCPLQINLEMMDSLRMYTTTNAIIAADFVVVMRYSVSCFGCSIESSL